MDISKVMVATIVLVVIAAIIILIIGARAIFQGLA